MSSLVPFLAIACNDECGFQLKSSFCWGEDEEAANENLARYLKYSKYKLESVTEKNYFSLYESQLGTWYVKRYGSHIYIVTTNNKYPQEVAIECLDELCETFTSIKKNWCYWKRDKARDSCCAIIAMKYGSLLKGSAPDVLLTEVDEDIRLAYSNSIRDLFRNVEILKNEMNKNILESHVNVEKSEEIRKKSAECLELAKVFKKRARKLSWQVWTKKNKSILKGAAIVGAISGITGLVAGATAGAIVVASGASAAHAIDVSIGAAVFAAGFAGAKASSQAWLWNQKFLVL
mmetsp:Transcript_3966/g.4399  ORF Transcript_3966/g.4399 Transcript_3966/m.4399 type:complete len:290 (+) Transcript_3966:65-934(+)